MPEQSGSSEATGLIFSVGTTVRLKGQRRWLGEVIGEREDQGGRYVEMRGARNGCIYCKRPEILVAKPAPKRKRRRKIQDALNSSSDFTDRHT